jgi:exportin-2 (importin alpha re-exporter)
VPNVGLRGNVLYSLYGLDSTQNISCTEHDMEQFEDDPLEFIRLDLSLSSAGTDLATRQQAAADVLQALVGSGFDAEATEIVGSWITTGLTEYNANPRGQLEG